MTFLYTQTLSIRFPWRFTSSSVQWHTCLAEFLLKVKICIIDSVADVQRDFLPAYILEMANDTPLLCL